MTDENEQIELTHFEDNLWYWLAQKAIEQDAMSPQPYGWHWLILLHYVLGFNVADVQKKLPNEHPLKSTPLPSDSTKHAFKPTIDEFKQKAGIPAGTRKEITAIDFSKLIFSKTVKFSNFIFPVNVDFESATFSKQAIFTDAVFLNITNFYNTKFSEEAGFENALFSRMGNFNMAVFSNNVEFSGVKFSYIAGFRGTTFYELADFSKAKFEGHTTFADAKFKKHAPHFYSAKMSEDITWDRVRFPSIKIDTNRDLVQQNKEAYENLSGLMEKMKKHDDQHLFFRQEMQCRRWLGNSFNHLIHGLYEWFADYGYGVGYALCWWVGHIALGVLVIAFIATIYGDMQFDKNLPCAISVSFANANPYAFFGFDSVQLTGCYDMFNKHAPILFALVKVIQTILGIALLFIVGLTLRIRFRLK